MSKPARQEFYLSARVETRAQLIGVLKRVVQELQAGATRGESLAAAFETNWHIWAPGEKEALLEKAK